MIDGKTALVTGGGRGIGFMISKALVLSGCTVFISSRKQNACDEAAEKLTNLGHGKCISLPAVDLSKGFPFFSYLSP